MKKILSILTLFTILLNSCTFNCESYLNEKIKPFSFNGIVLNKQKTETGCFGLIILSNKNEIDTINDICYCVPEKEGLWKYIQSGDSLHKKPNNLTVEVYRKDIIKKFDFPCCSQ